MAYPQHRNSPLPDVLPTVPSVVPQPQVMAKWITLAMVIAGGGGSYTIINVADMQDKISAAATHAELAGQGIEQIKEAHQELKTSHKDLSKEVQKLTIAVVALTGELKVMRAERGQRRVRRRGTQ